jgi:cytochrome c553
MLQNVPDDAGTQLAQLEQQQRALQQQRKGVQIALKAEKRKQSRIMNKAAKSLSDGQLVSIIASRAAAKAKAAAKAGAKATAKGKAKSG